MRRNYQHAGPRPLPFARLREAISGVCLAIGIAAVALGIYMIAGAHS